MIKRYLNNRAWNINSNITIATVLSTGLTSIFMQLLEASMITLWSIVITTAIVDALFDFLIFSWLHAQNNKQGSILKDTLRIQAHRIALSPVYYTIAVVLQTTLLMHGLEVGATVIVSYITAFILTRAIHTAYGFKTGLFERR